MQFYWQRKAEPVKQIFATVKSTIDTSNSSNTVVIPILMKFTIFLAEGI
jgi:predicted transcriptional regulator